MLWTCKRARRLLELNGKSELPEWVDMHLETCSHCREVLEGELDLQRVLQAVRSEPVPASRLEWSQVRSRLQTDMARRTKVCIPRYAVAGSLSIAVLLLVLVMKPFSTGESDWVFEPSRPAKIAELNQPDEIAPARIQETTTNDTVRTVEANTADKRTHPAAHTPESVPANRRANDVIAHAGKLSRPSNGTAGNTTNQGRIEVVRNNTVARDTGLDTGTRIEVAFAPSVVEEVNPYYLGLDDRRAADALPLPTIRCEGADATYLQVKYVSEANESYAF